MFRVRAENKDPTFASDRFAFAANFLYRCAYFHILILASENCFSGNLPTGRQALARGVCMVSPPAGGEKLRGRRVQNPRRGFCTLPKKQLSAYFILNTILPLVASYGENSTRTRSPGRTRIWCTRIFPPKWARISCPSSSVTRKSVEGSASVTTPSFIILSPAI